MGSLVGAIKGGRYVQVPLYSVAVIGFGIHLQLVIAGSTVVK